MQTAFICVSNDLLQGKRLDYVTKYLARRLNEQGVTLSFATTIYNHPDKITETLQNVKEQLVIVIGENSSVRNNNIKKSIAKYIGVDIVENKISKTAVNNYYRKMNSPVEYENENEYYLPDNCICIINNTSALQGYMVKFGEQVIIFLPSDIEAITNMFDYSIMPCILDNFTLNYASQVIKTFGIAEGDIISILKDLISNKHKILIATYPDDLECGIIIRYNKATNIDIVNTYIQKIYERLNKYIYANEDVSLYKRAYDLLKFNNKSIAIAESVTGGTICSNLVKENDGISSYLKEGIICYTDKSKVDRLKVSNTVINNYSAVSVESAYEMSAGLLETSGADIAVVTTGYATNTDGKGQYCFIAVGDMEGIHVYKNTFNFSRSRVINNIAKTSMFYLIKKLRQKDLLFNGSIV